MRRCALVLGCLLTGCGGVSSATDAGADASSLDAGRDAGSVGDGAVAQDAGVDAGADASLDAGVDCAVIGCGPPSVCGDCAEPCGCCSCGEGEERSSGGVTHVCSGGCYVPRGTGGSGDVCTSTAECGAGLSCCYPCGVPDCENVCEPTCAPGTPGCSGGCLLRP
jgi:hypothetical protein